MVGILASRMAFANVLITLITPLFKFEISKPRKPSGCASQARVMLRAAEQPRGLAFANCVLYCDFVRGLPFSYRKLCFASRLIIISDTMLIISQTLSVVNPKNVPPQLFFTFFRDLFHLFFRKKALDKNFYLLYNDICSTKIQGGTHYIDQNIGKSHPRR